MTQKDFSELKRRLDPNRRNPTAIIGCFVSDDGEVLTSFRKPVAMLPQEEIDRYMAIFRKVLSGTQGQNLLPVGFEGAATLEDEAFALMQKLRASRLKDEEAVNSLVGSVMASLQAEKASRPQSMDVEKNNASNLILLLDDAYDQRFRRRDGEEDPDRSETMFTYFICCVCPVKPGKPELAYDRQASDFRIAGEDMIVGMPEVGFLYPAMVQGGADLYMAMFYTRDIREPHEAFLEHVFHAEPAMPASEQKESLRVMLSESLGEECSMEVIQSVHGMVSDMIRERKEDKQADPLNLTRADMTAVLKGCGVSKEKTEAFAREYDETFGQQAEIAAVNLVTPKDFRVNTPCVSIKVDPAHSELISTRTIEGKRYIMILADGAVEVNGVPIAIGE